MEEAEAERARRARGRIGLLGLTVVLSAHCSAPAGTTPVVVVASPGSSASAAPLAVGPKPLTQPCRRHLDWAWSYEPTPEDNCRNRGLWCHDQPQVVTFPVCEQEVLDGVVHQDVYQQSKNIHRFLALRGARKYIALRGYLRRDQHRFQAIQNKQVETPPGSGCPVDTDWSIRLEQRAPDGTCSEALLGSSVLPKGDGMGYWGTALCWGDGTVACCASNLVDSDEEVVAYWADGQEMPSWCTPRAPAFEQNQTHYQKNNETSYDRNAKDR